MKKIFVLPALVLSFLTGCAKESASVGIIGGADGPTVITVSQNVPMIPMAIVVVGIVVIVAIIIVFVTHKKD